MTPQQIRDAIKASPELMALVPDTVALAAALSVGRTKIGMVPTSAFASWAAGTGMRAVIEDKAELKGDPLRSSALAMKDVLQGGASGIRLDYPENVQMLAAWVALGALAAANRDSLMALATTPDPVPEFDVRVAIIDAEGNLKL